MWNILQSIAQYFQYIYEDSMDLIAKLPTIAAIIYRNLYREGTSVGAIDPNKDWSANFTSQLGYEDPQFADLLRLYLTIHRLENDFEWNLNYPLVGLTSKVLLLRSHDKTNK